jgi:hypothetical protein
MRLVNLHGIPPIKAHFAVRRVALGMTPDRYTPLVHAEAQAAAREAAQRAGQVWADSMRAMQPQFHAMAEAAKQAAAALRAFGLVDQTGRPARTDRPAWVSPYGPPARRRR